MLSQFHADETVNDFCCSNEKNMNLNGLTFVFSIEIEMEQDVALESIVHY